MRPVRALSLKAAALAAVLSAAAALLFAAAAPAVRVSGSGLYDARYCEVIELKGAPPTAIATVWNTIGLNRCPAARWNPLAAGPLAKELGDTLVVLNGPRHFLMDSASAVAGRVRAFHGLRMRKVATIAIRSVADLVQTPYTDRTITRTNSWTWHKGRTVFELVAPGGDTYVMQSYAQIKDPTLTLAKLPSLGPRMKLPPGWRYRTRTLTRSLVLSADGRATITQDPLQNTYQLATSTRRGPRRKHAVSVTGRTRTVSPATPGTVEDHGTLTGTPFGADSIVLVGTLGAGRLTGSIRLTFPNGSVIGTVAMPFTIVGKQISFRGAARFTAGTGAYRGISSGAMLVRDHNTLDGQNGRISIVGAARY